MSYYSFERAKTWFFNFSLFLSSHHISVCLSAPQISPLYSQSPPGGMMIQQNPPPAHLPPETKQHQAQTVVTTQIFYPQLTLINRQKRLHQQQTTRSASPILWRECLRAPYVRERFGRFSSACRWSSASSNSPHHFTFQFLLASTPRQWNLWFLDRVFLQNRSYRER